MLPVLPDLPPAVPDVLLILLALMCVLCIAQALFPRLTWVLVRWQYRNPDMVEPSPIVFQLRRVRALVMLAICTVALVMLFDLRDPIPGG